MGSGLLLGVESFSRLRFRLWERFLFDLGFGISILDSGPSQAASLRR